LVKALEIAPDDVRLLQNMALQQRQRGDRKAAIGTLEKAASVGGDEFVYPALLGLMLYDEKLPEDAEKWLLRVKPADANYAEARFRLAQIMIARGDREPARASLSEAIRARPSLLNQAHSLPELEALLAPDLRPIPAQEH